MAGFRRAKPDLFLTASRMPASAEAWMTRRDRREAKDGGALREMSYRTG